MARNINSILEYATRLAEYNGTLSFEDNFKLASLCQDIYECKESGELAHSESEKAFKAAIVSMYQKSGKFRSELEMFDGGKRFVLSFVSEG